MTMKLSLAVGHFRDIILEFVSWTSEWKQQKTIIEGGGKRMKNQEKFQFSEHEAAKRREMAKAKEVPDNMRERRDVECTRWKWAQHMRLRTCGQVNLTLTLS